ncbi:MAG TPA: sodium/solute symporter [Acidobacteriaceae bacterium]|nr:sodium/solute symporter [Acidobacteriaceae bacterium]
MQVRLHPFDLGVVALYLVAITLFGLRFARRGAGRDKSLRSYFLADKTVPWWAIALSIVSAETSTLTIIGTPGLAFAGDFGFLQVVTGYMVGRFVVGAIFLPRYFHGEMLTAYQLIERRFGHTLYRVTAGLFLLTRAAAEGVRVFAVSIVVAIAIGTGDIWSIAIISALTLLYTFEGGMTAVIWTDVVQMAIYIGGTFVALWSLGTHVPGGWAAIHAVGAAAGKFHMWSFALNMTTAYTFWAGVIGGTFLTMASHGTDQLMVQRMLAAKDLSASRAALAASSVIVFIQFALFLLIGVGLWAFYGQHPAMLGSTDGNHIFPEFIVRQMPSGIAGLLIAAILAAAMSNLSAALNSLSSATVVDFYMGLKPRATDGERIAVSRTSTVLWALVLFAVAVYAVRAGGKGNVVEIGLSIASVAYGSLLGVFLLGMLTRYTTENGAIVGMIFGFVVNLLLWRAPGKMLFGAIAVPNVAWTWYVLIGTVVTFVVGLAASTILRDRKSSAKKAAVAAMLLASLLCCSRNMIAQPAGSGALSKSSAEAARQYDFSAVSAAINTAIAQKKLPGAVVLIGHDGRVVFEQSYGVRKLAGEPGLDGKPSPAEPMTTDTIFDMASLTKCLATATAVMQLYEQGKFKLDDPVVRYLPEFGVNGKEHVTIRELLTHYSGLPPDVDLKDAWGLVAPAKAEGIRRAMNAKLDSTPGTKFVYSDINFMTLGALVEKLSGETLDVYAQQHIFMPLGMAHTRFLPMSKECGQSIAFMPFGTDHHGKTFGEAVMEPCAPALWNAQEWIPNIAPTQHDNEGTATTNPDFDHLLRGTVHDPTTRRMGGVAGQAGVFSTGHDVGLFAQALLDKLLHNNGPFPLQQSTLKLMTVPEQPATAQGGATVFTPDGQPATGVAQRGFGWDINSAYSRPRGSVFPTVWPAAATTPPNTSGPAPSFGHTGFTGTSLWIDPQSDSYVILLANSVHPRGNPPISPLRGEVATAAAKAMHICYVNDCYGMISDAPAEVSTISSSDQQLIASPGHMLAGVDVLEQTKFKALTELAAKHGGHLRVGLLTNQTGIDSEGRRTIDVLRGDAARAAGIDLVRLFSPEHGLFGKKDSNNIGQETDEASGLKVVSLYGAKDADKRPKPEDLKDLDAVVIDLQDAGARFYTYETVVGYFIDAASCEPMYRGSGLSLGKPLEIVVLDRPDPIGGEAVQGPVSDTAAAYINYMPEPLRQGMTLGELAEMFLRSHRRFCSADAAPGQVRGAADMFAPLTVVKMQGWRRAEFFDQTGLRWVNPSPNLRSVEANVLYPALGMLDYSNVSVGRGSEAPFEVFGAGEEVATKAAPAKPAWFDGKAVAAYLTARNIPGVTFAATRFAVTDDANHYPYHGQTIEGVRLTVTDRKALDSPELGIEILAALHHLYPAQFKLDKAAGLVANSETMAALVRGDDPRAIAAAWKPALDAFKARRAKYLLYP